MKTSTKHQEPTAADMSGALLKIAGIFAMTVLTLAGKDLIDQIMIWLF